MVSFYLDVACSEVFTTCDCFSELSVFIFFSGCLSHRRLVASYSGRTGWWQRLEQDRWNGIPFVLFQPFILSCPPIQQPPVVCHYIYILVCFLVLIFFVLSYDIFHLVTTVQTWVCSASMAGRKDIGLYIIVHVLQ